MLMALRIPVVLLLSLEAFIAHCVERSEMQEFSQCLYSRIKLKEKKLQKHSYILI